MSLWTLIDRLGVLLRRSATERRLAKSGVPTIAEFYAAQRRDGGA